jgi:PleD family two-component response regulator
MFLIAGRDPRGPTPYLAEFLEQIHADDRDRVTREIAAAAEARLEPEGDPGSAPRRGHGRILLADDEEAIRSVCTGLLEELGFEVTTVENGRQAVAAERCDSRDLGSPEVGDDVTAPR